jgi:hypothetical protein
MGRLSNLMPYRRNRSRLLYGAIFEAPPEEPEIELTGFSERFVSTSFTCAVIAPIIFLALICIVWAIALLEVLF